MKWLVLPKKIVNGKTVFGMSMGGESCGYSIYPSSPFDPIPVPTPTPTPTPSATPTPTPTPSPGPGHYYY